MFVAALCRQTDAVGQGDWLERGHGGGDGLRPMIKSTAWRAVDRVSIRSVLRGGEVRPPRKPRRRTKALVGWLLYCCTAVAGTAAAHTVRDTLFPQLGGPSQALWVSPSPEVPRPTEHGSSSTEGPDTTSVTVDAAIVAASERPGPRYSPDAQPVPSASSPNADQLVVDHHGPSAGAGPSTGSGVPQGPDGHHDTIVDVNPTVTSNASPRTSADPTSTTVSTPNSPASTSTTTPDSDGGKGPGGGSGGGGGRGGDGDGGTNVPASP